MRCRAVTALALVTAYFLTTGRSYPFRIETRVGGKPGVAAVDQLRTVDKQRLVKKVSKLQGATARKLMDALAEMFAN